MEGEIPNAMHRVLLLAEMEKQRLEDYVAALSESEKIQYKYIIDECRQRDIEIKRNCDDLKEDLEGLFKGLRRNAEALQSLKRALQGLRMDMPVNSFRDYPQSFN